MSSSSSHHMSGGNRLCKGLILVLLLLGFIIICLVGVLENGGMKMEKTTLLANFLGRHKNHAETTGRENGKLDIHFISKRRVPNGPDPIHNRRAGNSCQPPGKRA